MNKRIQLILTMLFLSLQVIWAQNYPPTAKVYGSSPFQDSIWSFSTLNNSFSTVDRLSPTLSGFVITGINGMAYDPCEHITYVIMKVTGVTGRVLGTIDLNTGVCTQVGNLGDNFSSITFDRTGQLYGVTGDGATVSETLYTINKNTGAPTLLTALGNGADGEVICYNSTDNMIYHWSGNGTVIYEKIQITSPFTITNIPITGTTGNETFGALYYAPDTFLISNISSNFVFATTNGVYGSILNTTTDDIRGTVLIPAFAVDNDTICAGDVVNMGASGIPFYDAIYHWGDGSIDTVAAGSGIHTYSTPGTRTIHVVLDNGFCTPDTVFTQVIEVKNIPSVALSGVPAICPGGGTLLTGSSGGTSQWYLNGVAISAATNNTYTATVAGTYNMTKTNQNGCSDSAAVGVVVLAVPNPTVALGTDTTFCGSTILDAQNLGATYLWATGETSQTLNANNSGAYSVIVTDSNTCVGVDTINLVINTVPIVTLGNDTSICGTITLDAQNAGSTYAWASGETTQTLLVSSSGTYSVTVTNGNGCSETDDIVLTVNSIPVVTLSGDTSFCAGDSTTLTGSSGGTSQWYLNGVAISGATNNVYVATQAGLYNMEKINTNGCSDSAALGLIVTVNALPIVTYQETDTVLCNNVGTAITLVAGSPIGGVYSGTNITGNSFDPIGLADGAYVITYTFTDANGCVGSDASQVNVSICSGLDITQNNNIVIFPNPTKGVVTVDMDGVFEIYQVQVIDALGRVVYNGQLSQQLSTMDLSFLASGIYIIQLNSENERFVTKLIKE